MVSILCEHCGAKPATCYGKYEGMTTSAYACDDCCGHGCEDGKCEFIEMVEEQVDD